MKRRLTDYFSKTERNVKNSKESEDIVCATATTTDPELSAEACSHTEYNFDNIEHLVRRKLYFYINFLSYCLKLQF